MLADILRDAAYQIAREAVLSATILQNETSRRAALREAQQRMHRLAVMMAQADLEDGNTYAHVKHLAAFFGRAATARPDEEQGT